MQLHTEEFGVREELGSPLGTVGFTRIGPEQRPGVGHALHDPSGERVVGVEHDPGVVVEFGQQLDQALLVEGDVEEREFAHMHVRVDDQPASAS